MLRGKDDQRRIAFKRHAHEPDAGNLLHHDQIGSYFPGGNDKGVGLARGKQGEAFLIGIHLDGFRAIGLRNGLILFRIVQQGDGAALIVLL